MLRDSACCPQSIAFNTVFELRAADEDALVYRPSNRDQKQSRLAQIAKYVAATGQILNIGDVSSWMSQEVREMDGFVTRAILCMPILNGQKTVIGVAQLINKVRGGALSDQGGFVSTHCVSLCCLYFFLSVSYFNHDSRAQASRSPTAT